MQSKQWDQFSRAPRKLTISSEQTTANGVVVAVRDTGSGIHPEHVERVFEAFYTTKRSIIDAHGGRLWAETNEPRGALLRFILPVAEASSAQTKFTVEQNARQHSELH